MRKICYIWLLQTAEILHAAAMVHQLTIVLHFKNLGPTWVSPYNSAQNPPNRSCKEPPPNCNLLMTHQHFAIRKTEAQRLNLIKMQNSVLQYTEQMSKSPTKERSLLPPKKRNMCPVALTQLITSNSKQGR